MYDYSLETAKYRQQQAWRDAENYRRRQNRFETAGGRRGPNLGRQLLATIGKTLVTVGNRLQAPAQYQTTAKAD